MSKEFVDVLEEQLNGIEAEQDRIARIQQIDSQIAELKKQISQLETQKIHEAEKLMGDLAVSVRQVIPGISVGLRNGKCNISYLSNNLSLRPDFMSKRWEIEPNRSGRRFKRNYGHALGLKHDIYPLSDSIADFFRNRYKSLRIREDVSPSVAPKPNMGRAIQHKGISKTQGSGYYA